MTLVRGFRGTARGFSRTAARMAAAGLVITAIFAAVWTGSPASASSSAPRSPAAAATSPTTVKYYIVPKAGNGGAQSLFTIAAKTLGDGNRYLEIFDLNKGRLQADGGRLTSPQSIKAGWVLELPANASGPGVHTGPLPGSTPPATPPASHRPTQAAAASSAGLPVGEAIAGGGALVVIAGAGLAVMLGRRSKRRGLHGRVPGPRAGGRAGSGATARLTTRVGQRAWQSGSYQPGRNARRPAAQRNYQGSVEPDDQSWPDRSYARPPQAGRPAAAAAGFQGQLTPDHPSWHGTGYPNARDIRRPAPARGSHDGARGAEHQSWSGDSYPRQSPHAAPTATGFQGQLTPDHPSWPGASYPPHRDSQQAAPPRGGYQGQLTPDHPSWPGENYPTADDARKPARPLSGNEGQFGPEHPSWPGGDQRSQARVIGGSAEPRPVSAFEVHHEPRGRTAPQPVTPAAGPMPGGPGMGQQTRPPAAPPGSSRHLAGATSLSAEYPAYDHPATQHPAAEYSGYENPAHQPRHGRDPGGQSQAVLTRDPRGGYEQAASRGTEIAVDQSGAMADPVRQRVQELWNTDSFRLVERMLSEADDEATKIIDTAQYEAAEIRKFAADRAAATLTSAEREAADLRAAVMKMTTDLGGVAAYVTENLAIPTMPGTRPAARPAALPSAEPAILPADQPGAQPAILPGAAPGAESTTTQHARPAAKPAVRSQPSATESLTKPAAPTRPTARPPAARPGVSPRRSPKPRTTAKPKARQVGAWRKMVAALVIFFMVGMTSAAAEIGMHGLSFFVFRNAGAGAGNSHDFEENQGPGQPDAPGAHHKAQAKPHAKPHPGKPDASASGKATKGN
jgi:hypothetical protein